MDRLKGYIIGEENIKADLEGSKYLCLLYLLDIGYKKMLGCFEHGNELAVYTRLHRTPTHLAS
jgi:hypothetical protein